MNSLQEKELERTARQTYIDSNMGAAARNKLGQFATPPALAQEIAEYAGALWKKRKDKIRFFEPALGTGAFFSALVRRLPAGRIERATGVEINPDMAKLAQELWKDSGLEVINSDFTSLAVPSDEGHFNLIMTNPPYVRHHHLNQDQKVRLKAKASSITKSDLSGLAGLYCYFILLCDDWLADEGLGIWLVPSEFMDVNYGAVIKEYLLEQVTLLHIHRFDPAELQFDDALTSSAIVVYQKTRPNGEYRVEFSYGGSLQQPAKRAMLSSSELAGCRKWSGLGENWKGTNSHSSVGVDEPTLSSIFMIKRGIATGANNFFILPRARALALGIDERFLKPILPSPRYLEDAVVEADENGYPRIDKPSALIDTDLPEEVLKRVCRPLWEYLRTGEEQGVRDTYLAGKRSPWYRQEHRDAAPFVCTYMGRPGKAGSPFRFLWNKSRAVAPNVYHLLYPVGPLKVALEKRPELAQQVFALLQQIESATLVSEGRVYGGGLYKLEPNELGRVGARHFEDMLEPYYQMQPDRQIGLFDVVQAG